MTAVQALINKFTAGLINPLITLLFAVATLIFVWGIISYVVGSQGEPAKLQKGKQVMIWGIVGMFVMASAFGIVRLLCDFFGTSPCI